MEDVGVGHVEAEAAPLHPEPCGQPHLGEGQEVEPAVGLRRRRRDVEHARAQRQRAAGTEQIVPVVGPAEAQAEGVLPVVSGGQRAQVDPRGADLQVRLGLDVELLHGGGRLVDEVRLHVEALAPLGVSVDVARPGPDDPGLRHGQVDRGGVRLQIGNGRQGRRELRGDLALEVQVEADAHRGAQLKPGQRGPVDAEDPGGREGVGGVELDVGVELRVLDGVGQALDRQIEGEGGVGRLELGPDAEALDRLPGQAQGGEDDEDVRVHQVVAVGRRDRVLVPPGGGFAGVDALFAVAREGVSRVDVGSVEARQQHQVVRPQHPAQVRGHGDEGCNEGRVTVLHLGHGQRLVVTVAVGGQGHVGAGAEVGVVTPGKRDALAHDVAVEQDVGPLQAGRAARVVEQSHRRVRLGHEAGAPSQRARAVAGVVVTRGQRARRRRDGQRQDRDQDRDQGDQGLLKLQGSLLPRSVRRCCVRR